MKNVRLDPSEDEAGPSSRKTFSSNRARVLAESSAAVEKKRKEKLRGATWTKRYKYEGYQSTLDSNNNLKALRQSKSPAVHLGRNCRNDNHSCIGLPGVHRHDINSDPLMQELEDIIRDSAQGVTISGTNQVDHETVPTVPIPARDLDSLFQPDHRPITPEELSREIQSIYSGLVMVEDKCRAVDRRQAAEIQQASTQYLPSEHWEALTALHRELLREHHDFFLATQHPSASDAIRNLGMKYGMPVRMWQHGIYSILEQFKCLEPSLRQAQLDHMVAFTEYSRQTLHKFQEYSPEMAMEWVEIEDGLTEYIGLLKDFQLGTIDLDSDINHSSIESSAYTSSSAPSHNLFRYLYNKMRPRGFDMDSEIELGDLFKSSLSNPLTQSTSNNVWLPEYISSTLSCWLYFGQSISKSFNIFAKTFVLLSNAAVRHFQFFFGPFRGSRT